MRGAPAGPQSRSVIDELAARGRRGYGTMARWESQG